MQQRVQIAPVQRGEFQPRERVRGKDQEGKKCHADRALHRQHPRPQAHRQIASEPARTGPEQRKDQHPQQHRPFVIAPDTADFIDQRLVGMRIQIDQLQREIRHHKSPCQRGKGKARQQKLDRGGRFGQAHPADIAPLGANQRDDHLDDGNAKGQNQGKMREFI